MVSSTARPISRNWSLPNILTYARVAAVPLVAGLLFWPDEPWARWTALAIFIAAGISDFFDGYLARAWSQQSSLGRMLDPIADKLLVSAVILVLAANQTISGPDALGGDRHPLPGNPGLGPARTSGRAQGSAAGYRSRQVEDLRPVHRPGLPDRGVGRRSRAAGRRHDRYCAPMDRGPGDALHRLGLYEGELRQCRERLRAE